MTTETQRDLHEAKRDLASDLAICNSATAGPWTDAEGNLNLNAVIAMGHGCPVCGDYGSERAEDALFIVEARTAWPHAIERAISAELELPAARALLKGMRVRVKSAEGKWARLREIVATNATGNRGTDINDWDVMLNVMDDIMTGGDGDE